LVRALLYIARPASSKLANMPDTSLYRDVEQYPGAIDVPRTLIVQIGSPIYFANSGYMRERYKFLDSHIHEYHKILELNFKISQVFIDFEIFFKGF